jgi:hypothetical protein
VHNQKSQSASFRFAGILRYITPKVLLSKGGAHAHPQAVHPLDGNPSENAVGVYKTEYSLDGGISWSKYDGLIHVIAENVPLFLARSVDLGDNYEFPFVAKRLRPYRSYLPALRR